MANYFQTPSDSVTLADAQTSDAVLSKADAIEARDSTPNGNCLSFDGVDDYLDLGTSSDFSFCQYTTSWSDLPFSIEIFIYPGGSWGFGDIFYKGVDGYYWEYRMMNNGSGDMVFYLNDVSGLPYSPATMWAIFSASYINTGAWNHIVVTYDGRGGANAILGVIIYVNNSVMSLSTGGSVTPYSSMQDGGGNLYIAAARAGYGPTNFCNIKAEEPRFYKNRVLTAGQVSAHYKSGRGLYNDDLTNLSGAWHLDKVNGSITPDYSGKAHDGTVSGAPLTTSPICLWGGEFYTEAGLSESDSITMSDASSNEPGLNEADTFSLADSEAKDVEAVEADTTTMSDATAKDVEAPKADALTLSDASSKEPGLSSADGITLSDSSSKDGELGKSDTVGLSDATAKDITTDKADVISLADAPSKEPGLSASDGITASDNSTREPGLGPMDTVTLSDAKASDIEMTRADTTTLTDVAAKSIERPASDSFTLADTRSLEPGLNEADSFNLADAHSKSIEKVYQDTTVMADLLAKAVEAVYLDGFMLADLANRTIGLTVLDGVAYTDNKWLGLELFRTDNTLLSDAIFRSIELVRTQELHLADAFNEGIPPRDMRQGLYKYFNSNSALIEEDRVNIKSFGGITEKVIKIKLRRR